MALTLRLTAGQDAQLTEMAARENRSKNEIVAIAIEERAVRLDRSQRSRAAFDRVLERDAEALDLLSQ
ncbi:ribbon-helix-helix protein, CopG family [Glaciibacter flavus]|uniref:Ribbon-helix-helix protein, CopG family n=1 Tax=Orlajensenia flava TaxID=2565934 RepID=A0A4V6RZ47_9MICO|nr:ribbon-helix-helix protein, CopG family [Glaciibacter flavus]THG34347.1 ribbon-helix-helix protein, CopG family [Glaciibacter flavus]